ncbi:unnamed protein product [Medioppia subpectinata]|uniref:RING-type domain-containing protein n=1 Tax=Medioppia subpectinata TaxID=1979941 RepID=A0A7R9L5W1_9ACAR|nr:unnamed protein product [Medioppia subpectinata]CAG2115832.1 unnamed protein product [Medioppia subpectinata]
MQTTDNPKKRTNMLSIDLNCNYVMFGSFQSRANHLKITSQDIAISCADEKGVDYTVAVAFKDIVELKFCKHFSISSICLKADKQSNDHITRHLALNRESITSFKFNVNSSDISDHFITAVMSEQLTQEVVDYIQLLSSEYSHMNCYEISGEEVKNALKQIMNRIKDTLVMTQAIEDASLPITESESQMKESASDESIAKNIAILCPNHKITEPLDEMCCQPTDIMFGTFEVSVSELLFTRGMIKFLDIRKEKNRSKLEQHFYIQYNFIDEIIYNFQISTISLIIRLSDKLCANVHQFLKIGNIDSKRVFDINSNDLRENYLIIRFESQFPQIFWNFLNGIEKQFTNLSLRQKNDKLMTLLCESTKSQVLLLSKNYLENKVKELSSECNGLKRKCDQLEDNELFCAICLDKRSSLLTRNVKLVSTLCGHVFCRECLKGALKVRNACPYCVRHFPRSPKGRINPVYHELHV